MVILTILGIIAGVLVIGLFMEALRFIAAVGLVVIGVAFIVAFIVEFGKSMFSFDCLVGFINYLQAVA